jgi:PAS domain S-box-containing protein
MKNNKIRILIVDNDKDEVSVFHKHIEEYFPSAELLLAATATEGLDKNIIEKPDVILLDPGIPDNDPYILCRDLKKASKVSPVIFLTSESISSEARIKALDAGADAFLAKTVEGPEFRALVNSMLRLKASDELKNIYHNELEEIVHQRTTALETELADRKRAERKLILSLEKLNRNRLAILNLMEDLKQEMDERKKAENDLKEERNLLRTLIDNLPDTIYILDHEGKKVIANRADVRNIGFGDEASVLGKCDLDLFPGEIGKRGHRDNLSVINTGMPIIDREEYFYTKEGNVVWMLTSKYPLYDSNGKMLGLFGSGHDITNRKISEQELQRKNKELSFLNGLADELTQLKQEDNIFEFLARKIKEFSGAFVAVTLNYIPEKKAIQIRHIETDREVTNKIANSLGKKFFDALIPVSDENLELIIRENYAVSDTLKELTFGQLSGMADTLIRKVTGVSSFVAIANVIGGEYIGTTMLGFREGTVEPTKEVLVAFARMAATTIQRRQAEEKLKESEEKYRLLIENQGEGVAVVDLDEKFVFVNPAAEEMFGVEKERLLNLNLLEFVSPEQKTVIQRESKKRIRGEKSTYEIDICRPNGEKRTILITATPQFSNEGKLTGTFGVFRDITVRKQMEKKVIESEAYYRTLIDISPDGIITSDLEGNITYGSIKAFEVFSIPPGKDVKGTSIMDWVMPDFQDKVLERFKDIMLGNVAPETREYFLKKWNGDPFWAELSSSPLSDKDGRPTGLLIVCRDISERKRYEAELIMERDRAEENDKLKTAFLHNVSHEIRTPMNAIIGFSSLITEPGQTDDSRAYFAQVISGSCNQLLEVVSDIIEISNIEAGILKYKKENCNINSQLKELKQMFSAMAAEKKIELNCITGIPDDQSAAETDIAKFRKIMTNLLNNAFKFTSSGRIEFGCEPKEDYLHFHVSDTGIGISSDQHMKIFDRFYQVEHSVSRTYEGTGLGLTISKAYSEFLGGKIWVDSELGKGSVFHFTIPRSKPDEAGMSNEEVNKSVDLAALKKRTILIAEDDDNNFKLLYKIINSTVPEWKLIRAVNGKEAVDFCNNSPLPDLILMDIKMPVMDGYEAAAIIKEKWPAIKIIAQTAYAFERDREKVLEAGCDDYLPKPIQKSDLMRMIRTYL